MTYGQLSRRMNQYARWALDQGVAKGDVIGLLMTNRPEYLAIRYQQRGGHRFSAECKLDGFLAGSLRQCRIS